MAQTLYLPIEQVFTNLGVIGAGFKLYTYETTTSTPLATYSDTALSVANANPTIADSAGRFIQIFIGDAKLYKAVLKDADDVTVWTADPIDPKIFSLNDFDPRPTSFWGTTGGTSSAYTLVADPVVSAYSNTQTFFLDFHIACGAAPTLTYVSGGSALNLHKPDGNGGTVALEANDVLTGTYEARNNGTNVVILNPEIQSRVNANILTTPEISELTIATGEITATGSNHTIDTEGDAASDDLDTINGGVDGMRLSISCANASRAIVVKNGTGNIINLGGDITLANVNQKVELEYSGALSAWLVLNINKIVQIVNTQTSAASSSANTIPHDNTIPQNTEGAEVMTLAFTPKSSSNNLMIEVSVNVGNTSATQITTALFQDSTANALAASVQDGDSATTASYTGTIKYFMTAGTTSSTTFKVRVGGAAGTTTFNGQYSTAGISSITITEIQA